MASLRSAVAIAVALLAACDDYGMGPEGGGLVSGTYTGEAEIIGVEVVDVTFTLTEYLGGVTRTFILGSSPCTGPVNASFVVDRP